MSMVNKVKARLGEEGDASEYDLTGALAEAEELSSQFASVRPTPFAVPIERWVGLPEFHRDEKNAF